MNIKASSISVVALLLTVSLTAGAETVKGRIKYISNKANTIQINVKGKEPAVVRFDAGTRFENAADIKALNPPDLIEVQFEPGQPATVVKKIVFGLPPGTEIDIKEMVSILQGKQGPYTLGDARPPKHVPGGHVPSAVPIFPADEEGFAKALPDDKGRLLVFYCGGPTCPFTSKAVNRAIAEGYTNVKGFQDGIPGWKRAKLPVHTDPAWLAKHLDQHHVVLDVRDPGAVAQGHIQGAVSLPAANIKAMTKAFIKSGKDPQLPGVSDKRAPIILYADDHSGRDVLIAFKYIRSWGYSNVSVLVGGFDQWSKDGMATATGASDGPIQYVKKLPKGAVAPEEFIALVGAGGDELVFIDVRRQDEVDKLGKLNGARHIPLDTLAASLGDLPKDKRVIAYCENGIRAEMAYGTLRENGYNAGFLNETVLFDEDGGIACKPGNLTVGGALPAGC